MTAARAFLALYDELAEAHKRMKRDEFRNEITRRCAEFREQYPGNSEALVALQMHFGNRSAGGGTHAHD